MCPKGTNFRMKGNKNVAKIIIAGDAMVCKSDISLEDLKLVKKYRPNALKVMGGEDNKEVVFKVDVSDKGGSGSINTYGATFTKADESGVAIITMMLPEGEKSAKEYAEDKIGVGILHLLSVEEKLVDVLDEIKAEKESVAECIEVAE